MVSSCSWVAIPVCILQYPGDGFLMLLERLTCLYTQVYWRWFPRALGTLTCLCTQVYLRWFPRALGTPYLSVYSSILEMVSPCSWNALPVCILQNPGDGFLMLLERLTCLCTQVYWRWFPHALGWPYLSVYSSILVMVSSCSWNALPVCVLKYTGDGFLMLLESLTCLYTPVSW